MTPAGLARLVLDGSDEVLSARVEELGRLPRSEVMELLAELARHRSPLVRGWVSGTAKTLLGRDAVPILLKLAQDRDGDVRDIAVSDLMAVDPTAVRALIPALRRQLRSSDYYGPVAAAWRLAELGDTASADAIAVLADDERQDPWKRLAASAVVTLLRSGPEGVIERIHKHDHPAMQWLVQAAEIAATEGARQALAWLAYSAPDEECRRLGRLGSATISTAGQTQGSAASHPPAPAAVPRPMRREGSG